MNKKIMSSIYMFVSSMVVWLGVTITLAIRPELENNKPILIGYQIGFAILFLGAHILLNVGFREKDDKENK